ncbi:FAD/NAD(P)-binding domain-containing protein [Hypoxylon sp. FL1857]|nr:FAD/NAD(P)-binding domain-containing protein [Hypoxylon sp. FL1857]
MSSESGPASTSGPSPSKNVIVDGVLRFPPTGSKALVVGAGVGGLGVALECWRKGIEVEVIEKAEKISPLGDIFVIAPSALTTLHHYPSLLKEYDEITHDNYLEFAARNGTAIMPPVEFEWNRKGASQSGAYPLRVKGLVGRLRFAEMLFHQCKRLGIPVTFGVAVEKYEEDVANGSATAIALDGRRFTADLVIAADGIGTKSHAVTLGRPVRAVKTGFLVYRGMYSTDRLKGTPVAEDFVRNLERPVLKFLKADKIHAVYTLSKSHVSIGITTEDDDMTAVESWSSTVSNETALSSLPDPDTWDPLLLDIIRSSPENSIVRWSLCFRDPQPRWTSSGGRVVQLGDSAHSFLPTSGNGATQSLEDASSLPECLRMVGKEDVGIATKVHELLRYQRVSLIQHAGFVNMQDVHREADPNVKEVQPPLQQGKWLWGHNPEKYATENFAKARAHLEKGSPFENNNLPPGHKWSDWTMEDEFSKQKAGVFTVHELKRNGDWNSI